MFSQVLKAATLPIHAHDQRHRWSEPLQFTSNVFSQVRGDRTANRHSGEALFARQLYYKLGFLRGSYLITRILDNAIAKPQEVRIVTD